MKWELERLVLILIQKKDQEILKWEHTIATFLIIICPTPEERGSECDVLLGVD